MVQGQSGSWQPVGAAGAAAVTLLVLGGVLCCLLPSASAVHPSARISISFESESYVAEYNESGPSLLHANGTVSVKKDPSSGGLATLEAVIDTGWRLLVSPSTLVATELPTFFAVTVVVPQGTPHDLPARLDVICRFSIQGVGKASTTIRAGPVFGLALESVPPVVIAGQAQKVDLKVRLTNTGNAVDDFWIDATMTAFEHSQMRWVPVIGCCSVLQVGPGMSRTFDLTAVVNTYQYAPRDALSSMDIRVESMNAKDHQMLVRGSVVVYIFVKPGWLDWTDVDVPMAAVILWAAATCAIVASAFRTGKRQKSLRVPIVNPPPAKAGGVSRISPPSISPGAKAPGVPAKFVKEVGKDDRP